MVEGNNFSPNAEDIKSIFTSITSLVFNQIPIPINFVDSECRVVIMNKAFLDYLGLEHKDVVGKYLPEIDPFVRLPLVLKTGKAEIGQRHRFKDGREVIVHRIPLFHEGRLIGGAGIILIDDLDYLYNMAVEGHLIKNLNPQNPGNADEIYKSKYTFEDIFTRSLQGNMCKEKAKNYARTDFTVLITGESGVGKELFAHAIHHESKRRDKPFIRINCASIPETLIESELFGYEEGAFTGARKKGRVGKFEVANGGTIFLDEIGDLPLDMQAKLLRVLQENEIERVGSNKIINIDVRVIAATNCDLMEKVRDGKFRTDLFYRLNVLNLAIPSLKERREDIPLLIEHFITSMYQGYGMYKKFPDDIIEILRSYSWPGNVRELKNIVTNIVVNAEDDVVHEHNIPKFILENSTAWEIDMAKRRAPSEGSLKSVLSRIEQEIIQETLEKCNNNKAEAAKLLGMTRMSLYRKLKEEGEK